MVSKNPAFNQGRVFYDLERHAECAPRQELIAHIFTEIITAVVPAKNVG
jgi:hypothetical protein